MVRYEYPVPPATLGREIANLCAELSPGCEPEYVDVKPLAGAEANDCFVVVEAHCAQEGGSPAFGWSIWELPGVFVEAEFHAVWRSASGQQFDLTPKSYPATRILFLPDPLKRYEGRQVNNIRRAVLPSPDLASYFRTFDEEFEILNRGDRASQHGMVQLLPAEDAAMHDIRARRATLGQFVFGLATPVGPYTPCPCGSGRKAKWCHSEAYAG